MADCAANHPPAYVSRGRLPTELDCSESHVDELVKRGVLPKPVRLSNGCVRWCWKSVVTAVDSLNVTTAAESDPYLTGAKNVAELPARDR
jgi:predicted DNA-binding transcriptional regulator AlpA